MKNILPGRIGPDSCLARLLSWRVSATAVWSLLAAIFLMGEPALAHHPFGGDTPMTLAQGFLSGLGHPVIGLDHLAFVIAIGLSAAVAQRLAWLPFAFVMATVVGTGAHLAGLNLPMTELAISLSVLVFGALVVMQNKLNAAVVVLLAAIAGVFHGYAYGEAVIGAEMTPLLAYLVGFAGVESAISYLSYFLAQKAVNNDRNSGLVSVRYAGFMILGAGAAFLGGLVA